MNDEAKLKIAEIKKRENEFLEKIFSFSNKKDFEDMKNIYTYLIKWKYYEYERYDYKPNIIEMLFVIYSSGIKDMKKMFKSLLIEKFI